MDIPALGIKFSLISPNDECMSRIDRFLLSSDLLLHWKISSPWIGLRYISDHSYVILKDEGHD